MLLLIRTYGDLLACAIAPHAVTCIFRRTWRTTSEWLLSPRSRQSPFRLACEDSRFIRKDHISMFSATLFSLSGMLNYGVRNAAVQKAFYGGKPFGHLQDCLVLLTSHQSNIELSQISLQWRWVKDVVLELLRLITSYNTSLISILTVRPIFHLFQIHLLILNSAFTCFRHFNSWFIVKLKKNRDEGLQDLSSQTCLDAKALTIFSANFNYSLLSILSVCYQTKIKI